MEEEEGKEKKKVCQDWKVREIPPLGGWLVQRAEEKLAVTLPLLVTPGAALFPRRATNNTAQPGTSWY